MIRHVVMLRFKPGVDTLQRQEIVSELARLPGSIPEIQRYDFGFDLGLEEGNYDFAIVADFASELSYRTYQTHPEHQRVLSDHLRPAVASRVAMQHRLNPSP